MQQEIMLPVRPKWCELIASGKRTIEPRKTKPNCDVPFKVYIYCTQARIPVRYDGSIVMFEDDLAITNRFGCRKHVENPYGMLMKGEFLLNCTVIGEFVCDNVGVLFDTNGNPENYMTKILPSILQKTALSYDEFAAYVGSRADKNSIYGWHISKLKIYDKPKQLSDFKKLNRHCYYADLGYAKPTCSTCRDLGCMLYNPPRSFCYVERTR